MFDIFPNRELLTRRYKFAFLSASVYIFILLYFIAPSSYCQICDTKSFSASISVEQDGKFDGLNPKKPVNYTITVSNKRNCQHPIDIIFKAGPNSSNRDICKTFRIHDAIIDRGDSYLPTFNIIFEEDLGSNDPDFLNWISSNELHEWNKAWYRVEINSKITKDVFIIDSADGQYGADGQSKRHPSLRNDYNDYNEKYTSIIFKNENITPEIGNLLNNYQYCIDINASNNIDGIELRIKPPNANWMSKTSNMAVKNCTVCFDDIIFSETGSYHYEFVPYYIDHQGIQYTSEKFEGTGPEIEQISGSVLRNSDGIKDQTRGSIFDEYIYIAKLGIMQNFTRSDIILSIGYPEPFSDKVSWIPNVRKMSWNGQEYCNFTVNDLNDILKKEGFESNSNFFDLEYKFTNENDVELGKFDGPEISIQFKDDSWEKDPIKQDNRIYRCNFRSKYPVKLDLKFIYDDNSYSYANQPINYTKCPHWESLEWVVDISDLNERDRIKRVSINVLGEGDGGTDN